MKEKKYQKTGLFLLLFIVFFSWPLTAWGQDDETENDRMEEDIYRVFDFSEPDRFLEEHEMNIRFKTVIRELADGQAGFSFLLEKMKNSLFSEWQYNRNMVRKVVALILVTSLLTHFSGILKTGQVSEMGFFICYIGILTCLTGSFTVMFSLAQEVIRTLTDFMKALIPVYTVSIGISDGSQAASGFYEMTLMLITLIDFLVLKLILPAVSAYVGIGMINDLGKRDYLSKTCELLQSAVRFLIKSLLALVLGINVIHKMFSPVLGGIGANVAKRFVNSITGVSVGGLGVAELLYGTGILLRNAIGSAGVVVLGLLLAVPLVKMMTFIAAYHLTSALTQPVADERITRCLGHVAQGASMLLSSTFTVMVLFVITITVICI